jgi:hypothetical protein
MVYMEQSREFSTKQPRQHIKPIQRGLDLKPYARHLAIDGVHHSVWCGSARIPYGALKIGVYEVYEILLGSALARWGFSKFLKSMVCGACAGVTTGLLTARHMAEAATPQIVAKTGSRG